MRIASCSSRNGITASTGPDTSACAMRMSLRTPVKIVGSTNMPAPRSGRALPPSTQPRPLILGDLDVAQDLLELRRYSDRANLRIRLRRIGELRAAYELDQHLDEVSRRSVPDQGPWKARAAASMAALASCALPRAMRDHAAPVKGSSVAR